MRALPIAVAAVSFFVAIDARAAGSLGDCVSPSSAEDMLPGVRFGSTPYVLYRCRLVGSTTLPYDATGRTYAYDTPAWILAPADLAAGNGTMILDTMHTGGARAVTASGSEGERPNGLRLFGPRFLFREGRYAWGAVRWDKRAMTSPAPAATFDHLYTIKYNRPLGSYEAPADLTIADGGWLGAAIIADFADAVRSGRLTMRGETDERPFARVERTVAVGASQTARLLRVLLNEPLPGHHVPLFDGWYMMVARGKWWLWPQVDANGAFKSGGTILRDQPQPAERGRVIDINSEMDVGPKGTDPDLGAEYVRYGNPPQQRSYELAGASHVENIARTVNGQPNGPIFLPDRADVVAESLAVAGTPSTYVPLITDPRECIAATPARCSNPNNKNPFLRALMSALHDWMRDGTEPPPSRWLLSTPLGGSAPDPQYGALAVDAEGFPIFARDAVGNVLGGIRSPYVEAGIGRFHGRAPGNPSLLNGSYVDNSSAFASHADFVRVFARQAAALQAERFLLPTDADLLVEEAAGSAVGMPPGSQKTPVLTPF
jgi:hypothetical protein